jgi:hypothetical protein
MRKLTPELLDHLPHDDPGAIRSRRDLRRINIFMGNDAWIIKNIPSDTPRITEIGSGDGNLLSKIHKRFPTIPLTACDLAPRPDALPESVEWIRGNLLEKPPTSQGGTLIANLILHHFTDKQLSQLAPWIASFEHIVVNEPLRSSIPRYMGRLAYPFIHPITRHDMRVSIEAGFISDELPTILQLHGKGFVIHETSTWRGSQRMVTSQT